VSPGSTAPFWPATRQRSAAALTVRPRVDGHSGDHRHARQELLDERVDRRQATRVVAAPGGAAENLERQPARTLDGERVVPPHHEVGEPAGCPAVLGTAMAMLPVVALSPTERWNRRPHGTVDLKVIDPQPPRLNRLAAQASPYLRQHATNPVDWYPWADEALARARREDKPVFLSVGYAACHWCHVMERESFCDPDIATLLNTHFVAIKVDREERPTSTRSTWPRYRR